MNSLRQKTLSDLIKEKAASLGFDLCGIASSHILFEEEANIKKWCSSGMNGEMTYLCQNIDKRINPALLFPGAKSVIVTGLNYFAVKSQVDDYAPVISRYAYGENYHDVIIRKLNNILEFIRSVRPDAGGKSFVDSAPILEKAWAREAGLGWPGRHSVLINNKIGSFFFLGVIILNIEMDYDRPFEDDLCKNCRMCIESCPTSAINENKTIDARKCIAYLTIESKAPVPEDLVPKLGRKVFGCDRCQEVCPWNRKARPHAIPEFISPAELQQMTADDWLSLDNKRFKALFKKSAILRRSYERFMRNVTIVTKSGD